MPTWPAVAHRRGQHVRVQLQPDSYSTSRPTLAGSIHRNYVGRKTAFTLGCYGFLHKCGIGSHHGPGVLLPGSTGRPASPRCLEPRSHSGLPVMNTNIEIIKTTHRRPTIEGSSPPVLRLHPDSCLRSALAPHLRLRAVRSRVTPRDHRFARQGPLQGVFRRGGSHWRYECERRVSADDATGSRPAGPSCGRPRSTNRTHQGTGSDRRNVIGLTTGSGGKRLSRRQPDHCRRERAGRLCEHYARFCSRSRRWRARVRRV